MFHIRLLSATFAVLARYTTRPFPTLNLNIIDYNHFPAVKCWQKTEIRILDFLLFKYPILPLRYVS